MKTEIILTANGAIYYSNNSDVHGVIDTLVEKHNDWLNEDYGNYALAEINGIKLYITGDLINWWLKGRMTIIQFIEFAKNKTVFTLKN